MKNSELYGLYNVNRVVQIIRVKSKKNYQNINLFYYAIIIFIHTHLRSYYLKYSPNRVIKYLIAIK